MVSVACVLAALSLSLSAPRHPAAKAEDAMFPDVPKNHWAYAAVAALKKDGILVGYPNGTFNKPKAPAKSKPKTVSFQPAMLREYPRNSWVFKGTASPLNLFYGLA